jgi:hypothetical protein
VFAAITLLMMTISMLHLKDCEAGTQASAPFRDFPAFAMPHQSFSKVSCSGGLDPGPRRDDKQADKWIVSQSLRVGDRESRSKSGVVVNA